MFPGFVSVFFPDSVSGVWFRDRMRRMKGYTRMKESTCRKMEVMKHV